MAPSRIHIQQVRLEVGAPDAALARPLPERFSQLFQASLLAVLTDELTRHDRHDLLLRLPQLVLELPPVAAHRLTLDLPGHLRTALRQVLAALPSAPAAHPAALATEELATLRYFLLSGRLPWSTKAIDFDLDAVISQALRQQPAALRALLAQVGRWLPPRQRLAQQLALPTLGHLLGLVEPTHAAFVQAYLRDTLLAHYHRPLLAASAVTLRRVLHELALADLLGRQTHFNRSAFVERQLRQLATRYNLSYPVLLRQLAAAYALVSLPPAARAATLPGIIQGLQKAQAAAESSHATTSQIPINKNITSTADTYAALVYYLRYGSLPGAGPPLAQATLLAALAAVLRRGRMALGRLVQQAGGLGPAALALAEALPPAQQLLLHLGPRPTLLPPGEYGSHLESGPAQSLPTPPLEAYSLPTDNPPGTISFGMTRHATLGRLLRPTRHLIPAPAYGLVGAGSVAEAQAAIFQYLLAGGAPAALVWLRPLMRWVVARRPAAVALLLRRQAATSAVWPRLLAVADGATLDQLLAGTARAGRRAGARAGLVTLATGAVNSPRLAAFLKTLYLITHFGPAGALLEEVVWQLAAAQSLPRRATWHKISRLTSQWPALVAAPFAGLFGLLRGAPPVAPSDAGAPAPALAAQNMLLHYLQHGQAPWWQPAPVAAKTLGRTLRQLARQPAALRGFLRQHAHEATVQQQLARLADFSLLHTLLPTPGLGRGRRHVARPALAALDRYLGQAAGGARLSQFLREAYLAFASAAPTSAAALAPSRRLAAAAGLPWRTVRRWVGRLLGRYPALAADPFFGALLADALAPSGPARRLTATKHVLPAAPSLTAEAAGQLVAQYLQTGQTAPAGQLTLAFSTLLRPAHAAALARLRPYLSVPTARQRLVDSLSEKQFWGLLRQLRPSGYQSLAATARDWQHLLDLGLVQAGAGPGGLGVEVLVVAATPAGAAQPLAQRLLQLESALTRQPAAQTVRRLVQSAARQPGGRRGPLLALLATQLPLAAPSAGRTSTRPSTKTTSDFTTGFRPTTVPNPTPTSLRPKPLPPEPAPDETAYIANAGLVLLWPFFTMLFERLGYLVQRQFGEEATADRAAHLLQFLVTGEENSPEYHLVLNKLLCGVAQAHPLPRALPLTAAEKTTGEGLLGAALGQWAVLKNTSIAGLRETFLQRPGKLTWHPDRVALTVETKTVDILLDQCPWSIALIKLPWMALPLYVTWR